MNEWAQFIDQYALKEKNVVWTFFENRFVKSFDSDEPIMDAVLFMNRHLCNFRLKGCVFYAVYEPTLKEMGLLSLSRVEKIFYLKRRGALDPSIWDKFLVHKVERHGYDNE